MKIYTLAFTMSILVLCEGSGVRQKGVRSDLDCFLRLEHRSFCGTFGGVDLTSLKGENCKCIGTFRHGHGLAVLGTIERLERILLCLTVCRYELERRRRTKETVPTDFMDREGGMEEKKS